MNAQYRYQTLQQHGICRLTNIAQGYRNQVGRQNTQIEELQATITAKEEIITQWEDTIHHREDQIVESDALIFQRDTVIDFLQEQVHELNLNLGQAIDHINMLLLMSLRVKKKKNLKKSKESPRSTLSLEILFLVPIIPLPAVSHPWATLMTFSSFELTTS
jgi:predicted RNase H-like nuclease (RuvC/YqgF family)